MRKISANPTTDLTDNIRLTSKHLSFIDADEQQARRLASYTIRAERPQEPVIIA